MILARTKKWQVEQGPSGNYLIIYDLRGDGECFLVSYYAHSRTIECGDNLSYMPNSLKNAVRKWCEDKAAELLAENKVVIGDSAP